MASSIRSSFDAALRRLQEHFRAGMPAREIVGRHSDTVDEILTGLFADAVSSQRPSGIALIALGGYGRRELAPHSDLDLLLACRGWDDDDLKDVNRRLFYPLWDAGRDVGNRVRDPKEAVRSLDRPDEATALLDARLVAGDTRLFEDLSASVGRAAERRRATLLRDLDRQTETRHEQAGHSGHLLEPDIRDGRGGLRDIQLLRWVAKIQPGPDTLEALEADGVIGTRDREALQGAEDFLLRLRIASHLHADRRRDVLRLEDQDQLARDLGYEGSEAVPGDELMRDLYRHARDVDAIVTEAWERLTRPRRRLRRGARPVGEGCVIHAGRLEVVAATSVTEDATSWIRAFATAAHEGVDVGRTSLGRLEASLERVRDPLPWSDEARASFVEILEGAGGTTRPLELMNICGLLDALITGWGDVRCLPQRNLYHRYTVDRHQFATVAELAASRGSDDHPIRDAWSRVSDPEPMWWAALLHDIGKGRGGDHSLLGAELAADTVARAGCSSEQIEATRFLVTNHLLLAEVATRRDLAEPATVAHVVDRVGDPGRLAMLFLLTRADSKATGPEAWTGYRAALIRELYARTLTALGDDTSDGADRAEKVAAIADVSGDAVPVVEERIASMPVGWLDVTDADSAARQLELLDPPPDPREVHTSVSEGPVSELVVVARDRPGLFATIVGVLALRGIDVHTADAFTRADGIAVDRFRTSGVHGTVPVQRWEQVRADIEAAASGELDLDEALRRKAKQQLRRSVPPRGPARIVVDNDSSAACTLVEIHTTDRFGLLRTIAAALRRVGCNIDRAKVSTYGVDVVDVFYVTDRAGRKVTDPDAIQALRTALGRVLDR